MANIINQYGQVKLGVRYTSAPLTSTLWGNLYSVYNADAVGSSSLKTSLFAAYNGESNANDSFGSNNGTAVGGLTYTTGKIGNAFQFNGTTSYVNMGDVMDVGISSWSYSMWFNASDTSGNRCLFSKAFAANGPGRFALYFNANKLEFFFQPEGSINSYVSTNSTIATNTWYNVVCVLDKSDKLKIYLNGTLQTGTSGNNNLAPYVANHNTLNPFRIGSYTASDNTTAINFFSGKIDAFNIYNRVLTQSEITELYNSGNGAQYITDSFYKPTTNDALNTYNGTAQGGLTYGVGKVGTAFEFNGSNAAISFPTNSMNLLTGDFSISAWVNLPSSYNATQEITMLMNLNCDGAWFSNLKGFWFGISGNNTFFSVYDGINQNGCNWDDTTGSIIKANSGWVHIVAIRKASTGSKLYVNGVLKASNTNISNATYHTNYQVPTIGRRYILDRTGGVANDSKYATLNSNIDAVTIWNKELSATEITELYNSGNGKQYPN